MHFKKISGRATVAAVSLAAALLVVAASLMVTKAHAKTTAQVQVLNGYAFGPIIMSNASVGSTVPMPQDSMLIGLLLPAVRSASQPFTIQFLTGDLYISLPIRASTTNRMPIFFEAHFQMTQTGGSQLVIVNGSTNEMWTYNTSKTNLTARVLPAVQNGSPLQPLSVNASFHTIESISNADGSVSKMSTQHELIGLLLPAV